MHQRHLPLAFECPRALHEMPTRGDGRERWCSSCERAVHDLSRYSEVEARLLLRKSDGLCVAYPVDRRGEIQFRRTTLDRVTVKLASLALSVSMGVTAFGFEADVWAAERGAENNPGCGGATQPDRSPVPEPGEPVTFELPERATQTEPDDDGIIYFLGEADDWDDELVSLMPSTLGVVRTRLGGARLFNTNLLEPIREIVELTDKHAPK